MFRLDSCLKKDIYSKIKYNNKQSERSFALNGALTENNKSTDGHSLFEYRANIHLQGSFYPSFKLWEQNDMHVYLHWYASQTFQYVCPSLPLSKEALFQKMTPSRLMEFSVSIVSKHLCRPLTFLIKNLFMVSVRISSSGSRRKFEDHEKCVRVARGAAESNSSFLSALQTSQVHP